MGWKDWPYWLKGGTIAGLLDLIFIIIVLIVYGAFGGAERGALLYTVGLVQVPSFLAVWYASYTGSQRSLQFIISVILGILGYFIEGALIGWIVGKIKGNK